MFEHWNGQEPRRLEVGDIPALLAEVERLRAQNAAQWEITEALAKYGVGGFMPPELVTKARALIAERDAAK